MDAVETERIDRVAEPLREPGPGVIELLGAVGETQPGEVEGHAAKSLIGEDRQHLPVEERARRHPMQEQDGAAAGFAQLTDEAGDPSRLEPAASGAVRLEEVARRRLRRRLSDNARHGGILA